MKTYLGLLGGVLNTNGSENVERRSAGEPGELGPDRNFLSVSISNGVVYSNLVRIGLAETKLDEYHDDLCCKLNGGKKHAVNNKSEKSKLYYRESQIGKRATFTVCMDVRRMSAVRSNRRKIKFDWISDLKRSEHRYAHKKFQIGTQHIHVLTADGFIV